MESNAANVRPSDSARAHISPQQTSVSAVNGNIRPSKPIRSFSSQSVNSVLRRESGKRATPEQETVLRRAAEVAHKSLTDFILDAAYQAAEHTLLDQRLFMVSGSQYQALLEMLDRPESDNPGLADLFSRRPVWANE